MGLKTTPGIRAKHARTAWRTHASTLRDALEWRQRFRFGRQVGRVVSMGSPGFMSTATEVDETGFDTRKLAEWSAEDATTTSYVQQTGLVR